MNNKARANAEKLGFHNLEFRQGSIEKIPLTSSIAVFIVVTVLFLVLLFRNQGYLVVINTFRLKALN